MTHCPKCGAEVPGDARFCAHCGFELDHQPAKQEQPPLPFSPWEPPPMAQPAGAGGATPAAVPVVGPPLSVKHVGIAVGAILLFLLLVVLIGNGFRQQTPVVTPSPSLPILGVIGEPVTIGDTVFGVAFTDTPQQFENRTSRRGHFLSVGVVVGNRGQQAFTVDSGSLALRNNDETERFRPIMSAWGTPEELDAGRYQKRYSLPPHETVAGLLVFDVPASVTKPRLLVRDLNSTSGDFSGVIDLTRKTKNEKNELHGRFRPVLRIMWHE